jgi:hypothetical protein
MSFLVLGASGLVWVTPELAAGAYSSLHVVGVVHLFTLGWLTTSIMGALYQFLPVALGQPIASQRVAHLTFALHVPGLALFVAGLVRSSSGILLAGASVVTSGLLLFLVNLAVTLRRSTRRGVTWWAIACAATFLFVTLVLGVALSGNFRWGYIGAARQIAVRTHLHVALGGWVLLVMVGVAHRLMPMFLLSHGAREHFAKYAVALIAAGAGVLTLLHHVAIAGRELPALLIGSGLIAFLLQAREFYRVRHRPALDPGLHLAAGALGLLAVGLVLAAVVVPGYASARIDTAYVLVLVLGASLFVAAHYYKIVPFLVWNHRFGPLAGKRPLPRVADLYSARIANVAAALLVLGVATLAGTVAAGVAAGARLGAVLFASGVAVEAAQMIFIARRRPS